MKELIKERIEENKNLFSKEELEIIKTKFDLINKIYLIGILDKI